MRADAMRRDECAEARRAAVRMRARGVVREKRRAVPRAAARVMRGDARGKECHVEKDDTRGACRFARLPPSVASTIFHDTAARHAIARFTVRRRVARATQMSRDVDYCYSAPMRATLRKMARRAYALCCCVTQISICAAENAGVMSEMRCALVRARLPRRVSSAQQGIQQASAHERRCWQQIVSRRER